MTKIADSQSPLASTACWTAAVRAMESDRADRLFADPWAAALAGEQGATWLAAGLDTRAFSLLWPAGTQVFELVQPAVLQFKEQVLRSIGAQPTCGRKTIEVDLTGDWQESLVQAGFDPGLPSGWLLEGFLFYLPNDHITRILEDVSKLAAPGSWLGFDIINNHVLTSPWTRPWVDMQASYGAPWIGSLDDPKAFLEERGWEVVLSQAGQPEADHGRWKLPVIPVTQPDLPHNWYVVACRK